MYPKLGRIIRNAMKNCSAQAFFLKGVALFLSWMRSCFQFSSQRMMLLSVNLLLSHLSVFPNPDPLLWCGLAANVIGFVMGGGRPCSCRLDARSCCGGPPCNIRWIVGDCHCILLLFNHLPIHHNCIRCTVVIINAYVGFIFFICLNLKSALQPFSTRHKLCGWPVQP